MASSDKDTEKPSVDELPAEELRRVAAEKERQRQASRESASKNGWSKAKNVLRDLGVTILSLAGLVRELFFVPEPNVTIILILGGFLGIPFVMKADRMRKLK